MSATPYTDDEGWRATNVYRWRDNPNRAWYNALWTSREIIEQKFVKLDDGEWIVKWRSLDLRIGESEETV